MPATTAAATVPVTIGVVSVFTVVLGFSPLILEAERLCVFSAVCNVFFLSSSAALSLAS